jgi:hypothetical protein
VNVDSDPNRTPRVTSPRRALRIQLFAIKKQIRVLDRRLAGWHRSATKPASGSMRLLVNL